MLSFEKNEATGICPALSLMYLHWMLEACIDHLYIPLPHPDEMSINVYDVWLRSLSFHDLLSEIMRLYLFEPDNDSLKAKAALWEFDRWVAAAKWEPPKKGGTEL
jgi:hypothetical protein